MTFSLVAHCPSSGMVGAVVASSSMAVAARCLRVRAGVGAVASQNVTDPRLGTQVLDLLQTGVGAAEAVAAVAAGASGREYRQLLAADARGATGFFSGSQALGIVALAEGTGKVAAGNLLAREGVIVAMVEAFDASAGLHLGDRLVGALTAGLEAGGEAGPVHSAGLLLAGQVEWPIADLRVDWDEAPIKRLATLWQLWKPQMDAYVTRALHPETAPAYGVPGETR